ncbi:UNVERIFIED_CONTAM: hypothetical protein RMT77_006423 [Armadillidium vulgare]
MGRKGFFALLLVFSLLYFTLAEVETESKDDVTSMTRESRQRKWFQPSSFTLSNFSPSLKKSGLPADDDDDGGRFFKIIQKGSSMSPIEMLANIIKKAIEDLNDQFERFGETFALFVQNEVEIAALTPDALSEFSRVLTTIVNNSTNNIIRSTVSLIQALSNFLGIDLTPLVSSLLGDTILGGLPVTNSGVPDGLLGALVGPSGLLMGPLLG